MRAHPLLLGAPLKRVQAEGQYYGIAECELAGVFFSSSQNETLGFLSQAN